MNNLFAYGTLMCEDIFRRVAGCLPTSATGTLTGFSRHPVKGETYPAIIRHATAAVNGVVYLDLPKEAWVRLDRFEGELYDRLPVTVQTDSGAPIEADAYVWHLADRQNLETGDWDFDEFLRNHQQHFVRHYQGFSTQT